MGSLLTMPGGLFAQPQSSLSSAISQAEGYGVPGAIPTLANNPGDLALGDLGYGTMGSAGITVFPTQAAGLSALDSQLGLIQSGGSNVYNPNMSLAQMGALWSGGNPAWASNVAKALGVSPTASVGSVMASPTSSTPASGGFWSTFAQGMNPFSQLNRKGWSMLGAAIPAGSKASAVDIPRVVTIIAGLLLIGAGAFGLKGSQTIIMRTAGKLAG